MLTFEPVLAVVREVGELVIRPHRPYTREEYAQWSHDLRPYRLEILPDQSLSIMSPVSSRFSPKNLRFGRYLDVWAEQDGTGTAFDATAGFDLPDGSNRNPDGAWIVNSRLQLAEWKERAFYPVCPDFVAEIKIQDDRIPALQRKMDSWLANGARLAWLLDLEAERAWIYRPNQPVQEVADFNGNLSGEDVLPGFVLPLNQLRLPQ